MADAITPFDEPVRLWERLTFPTLREAWLDGWRARKGAVPEATDLLALGADAELLREMALNLAKLGMTGTEDIETMVRSWHLNEGRWRRIADTATRYAEGQG